MAPGHDPSFVESSLERSDDVFLCISKGRYKEHERRGGQSESFRSSANKAELLSGFVQSGTKTLAEVGTGNSNAALPTTHHFEAGTYLLGQLFLGPSFEIARTPQMFIWNEFF